MIRKLEAVLNRGAIREGQLPSFILRLFGF
jgi:hypothetical protein